MDGGQGGPLVDTVASPSVVTPGTATISAVAIAEFLLVAVGISEPEISVLRHSDFWKEATNAKSHD